LSLDVRRTSVCRIFGVFRQTEVCRTSKLRPHSTNAIARLSLLEGGHGRLGHPCINRPSTHILRIQWKIEEWNISDRMKTADEIAGEIEQFIESGASLEEVL